MYQYSLQFSKQTKKGESNTHSLALDEVLGGSRYLRGGQRRQKGFHSSDRLAAGAVREPSCSRQSPKSSNPNCIFWQQIFNGRSAHWNSAIMSDWLLAVAGFLWSMLWKINFTAQAVWCLRRSLRSQMGSVMHRCQVVMLLQGSWESGAFLQPRFHTVMRLCEKWIKILALLMRRKIQEDAS